MRTELNGEKCRARVLVVDDQPLIREGFKQIIGLQPDLELCGESFNSQGAIEALTAKKPDLMVLDLLGQGDGLELIKMSRVKCPNLRILVVSQLEETIYAERILRAGAHGFITKKQATSEVLNAIRAVLAGELYVGPRLATIALHKMLGKKDGNEKATHHSLENLTDRELQIFHLVGAELSVKKIAAELKLSVKTVETHRENIKHKLGFQSAGELARHASKWIRRNGESSVLKQLAG